MELSNTSLAGMPILHTLSVQNEIIMINIKIAVINITSLIGY